MKPNIIFLLIDGGRADKILNVQKNTKIPNINHLLDIGKHQNVLLTITPFIFIILLCVSIRWLGNRILILTKT